MVLRGAAAALGVGTPQESVQGLPGLCSPPLESAATPAATPARHQTYTSPPVWPRVERLQRVLGLRGTVNRGGRAPVSSAPACATARDGMGCRLLG